MQKSLTGLLIVFFIIFNSEVSGQETCYDAPYVPTPYVVVDEMFRIADMGKDDIVYDLGCGDGRIVIMAAEKKGARGVGIDIDPRRVEESRHNAIKAKVADRVRFIQQDLFDADISEATVVTLFLLNDTNIRLRSKLLCELKPGTRIVSHAFRMGEWKPDQASGVFNQERNRNHSIYFWVVPANVTGTWEWTMPAGTAKECYVLRLRQSFQHVTGTLSVGYSEVPLKDVKLRGDKLQFTIERKVKWRVVLMRFEGRVSGDSIEGNVESEAGLLAGKNNWKAIRDTSTVTRLSNF